jgi:hypothetical protein
VVSHIQDASKDTGVSFSYLMAQAGKESSFKTEAGSRGSSAAGLFQFTKSTWLSLIKTHGAAHGLSDLADHIYRTTKGDYTVDDATERQHILDLRRDPQLSSMLAGEYAKDNKARLEKALGRPVDSTDLYMAHFLGPHGAVKVLKAKADDPGQPAAPLLPHAAQKNGTVFYNRDHSARSVSAVYDSIRHAIERPMKQYAQLEQPSATGNTATGHSANHRAHRPAQVASASGPDPAWPFETGKWPPAYVPAAASEGGSAATDTGTQLAYTTGQQSADQISSPMPPASPVLTEPDAAGPLQRLLKGLFG